MTRVIRILKMLAHYVRLRRVLALLMRKARQAYHKRRGKRCLHLLHIGKTGGTAIKNALRDLTITDKYVIYLHPHRYTLKHVPRGEGVIFFLRDPISRYVSGYFSRQGEGKPFYFIPWRPEEALAFSRFKTPDELALALSSENGESRKMAENAMKDIGHVRDHFSKWLISVEYLGSRAQDIVFIGFQESLAEDFERLKAALDLPIEIDLPLDTVKAHRSSEDLDRSLSDEAVSNLKEWYKEDYELINFCRTTIRSRETDTA